MEKNIDKFIYWTPRILSILYILFLAIFSLNIIFPKLTLALVMHGLAMNNIPVLILLVVLISSWRYEIVDGIAFILAGLFYMFYLTRHPGGMYFEWFMLPYYLIIAGPAFIIGILFIIGWIQKKNQLFILEPGWDMLAIAKRFIV